MSFVVGQKVKLEVPPIDAAMRNKWVPKFIGNDYEGKVHTLEPSGQVGVLFGGYFFLVPPTWLKPVGD